MKKETYTPMEKILIAGAQLYEEAAATNEKVTQALEMDLLLLDMEQQVGLMDGLPVGGAI